MLDQLNMINYTPEQRHEIIQRPCGCVTIMNDIQFELRLDAAKSAFSQMILLDSNITTEARELYEKFPMWGFYLDDNDVPKRVYGISSISNKSLSTLSANIMLNNATVGGTTTSVLRRVDKWPENTMKFLISGLTPNAGLFIDPLGFIEVALHFS